MILATAEQLWRIRPGNEGDVPFIFSTWLRNYYADGEGERLKRRITKSVFMFGQHALIERLLKSSHVAVACNPSDPAQIYGYAVGETKGDVAALHYVYVKPPFRSLGVARQLVALLSAGCNAVHYTHDTE